ncbi:Aste57867_21675 [Aphanomyces stellatus]|uniref:Aste57867_21675 protein n=1 Tax=Aphanomyces stellatus TaxID=120398 RepID=A0A485LJH0_9STRA|nr:hypothetical protein As57867_021606 [Aphanomyces stellatus]VFT98344.1 Aste57867_21675 [Aphanomyces stellatus]
MLCSGKGLVALALCLAATALSWTSFVLPLWLVVDADAAATSTVRAVGVWGLCYRNGTTQNTCLGFFSAPDPKALDASVPPRLASQSLCSVYGIHGGLSLDGAYPKEILNDAFLKRTCGSMGSASLTFSLGTAILGTGMTIAYVVWSCADEAKSCMLAFSKLLAFAALVSNLLAILLWLVQASSLPMGAGVTLGASFVLAAASAVVCCAAIVAIGMLRLHERHERIREKSMRMKSLRDLERAATVGKKLTPNATTRLKAETEAISVTV